MYICIYIWNKLLKYKKNCLQLDIALWCKNQIEHSIWDESLLFCNYACSLEYSSLSTLAGLSYHICEKLEVAFKASPSSQHQHCTDEAQKAETVAISNVLFAFLQLVRMPTYQYPCSLVAQFTEDVYNNAGASDVLPLVMKSLDAEKVVGVQFLRAGIVRLTFDDPETCSKVLKDGLDLGDVTVQLFPADERLRLVHLRDLPVEVDHDNVSNFFSAYGEVLSVDHCYFKEYPSVRNGNRIVKILLTQDIPCFVEVEGCNRRVWYPRQPAHCSICREFSHRAPACPLSCRCRRCHQPGHVARESTQAWGPSFSVSRVTDYTMETEEEVPVTTASVTSASITVPVTTTSTVSTAAATAPSSCSTVTVSTAAATTSSSCSTVTVTAATVLPAVPVTAPSIYVPKFTPRSSECTDPPEPEQEFSEPSSRSPSLPKPSCPVSAKMFRSHLLEKFRQVELPDFLGWMRTIELRVM